MYNSRVSEHFPYVFAERNLQWQGKYHMKFFEVQVLSTSLFNIGKIMLMFSFVNQTTILKIWKLLFQEVRASGSQQQKI